MDLNNISTGTNVLIQFEVGGVWIEGEIAKIKGVRDKYVALHNGEEALSKEIRKLKILK